ncbi:MAG: DUF1501 domain-containing protein [Pirellulaceae bacterium]
MTSNNQNRLCKTVTPLTTRRDVLRMTSCGFGWLAFSGLFGSIAHGALSESLAPGAVPLIPDSPLAPKQPHFPARAKRVIFLCMRGGPSHVDTFDYKPQLTKDSGKPGPRNGSKLLGSKWKFSQCGEGGLWISDFFPALQKQAGNLCLINSMKTDLPAHPQALVKMHTGNSQFIRPSLGAWTLYGLGTENENLPGFVSIAPPSGFGGSQNYGSGFLPAIYQGTRLGNDGRSIAGAEIPYIQPKLDRRDQRAELDLLNTLNETKLKRDRVNPDVEGAIEASELAFKMQTQMPGVVDIAKESEATKNLYGIDGSSTDNFGRKLLLARRLAESGVRFIEVTHGNWDHHFNLEEKMEQSCGEIDRPIAGLLADLKQRGMLEDTLVVWTGEFGRTPYAQGNDGRDHNNKGFTLWMAGGGAKGGYAYGASDEYGYEAVENPVGIHDLHATILAMLGLDHERLTFNYAGRDFRLTDVYGNVVQDIIS